MKIDLTQKEIELLLLLMNDVFIEDIGSLGSNNTPILTLEERALMEKLESALRSTYIFEKGLLDSNPNPSNLSH
jgi:hypothetical protein